MRFVVCWKNEPVGIVEADDWATAESLVYEHHVRSGRVFEDTVRHWSWAPEVERVELPLIAKGA
jgi:hypothetical protein